MQNSPSGQPQTSPGGFLGELNSVDKASDKVSDKDIPEFLRTVLP
jgi:hypothetical protein